METPSCQEDPFFFLPFWTNYRTNSFIMQIHQHARFLPLHKLRAPLRASWCSAHGILIQQGRNEGKARTITLLSPREPLNFNAGFLLSSSPHRKKKKTILHRCSCSYLPPRPTKPSRFSRNFSPSSPSSSSSSRRPAYPGRARRPRGAGAGEAPWVAALDRLVAQPQPVPVALHVVGEAGVVVVVVVVVMVGRAVPRPLGRGREVFGGAEVRGGRA
ncbi:hypothetical protein B0J12DRAFT_185073 [Macrophomina phaseolina]|uniref:Uncharacterized protein n=1 Tax=Macrophomina phaseolina TaxID=35725 RepID=A0ABQ8G5Q7_9PEZI|nr:hypothetical protein B0J12DRAFT_185073 [Macrophomina phaseolina]